MAGFKCWHWILLHAAQKLEETQRETRAPKVRPPGEAARRFLVGADKILGQQEDEAENEEEKSIGETLKKIRHCCGEGL